MEAYYDILDTGLQAAGGDTWAILDAAIGANAFRENYFSYSNLRRPVELVNISVDISRLSKFLASGYESLVSACDWVPLGACIAIEFMTLELTAPGLAGACKASCGACLAAPPNPACVPCIGCVGIYGAAAATCLATNCHGL